MKFRLLLVFLGVGLAALPALGSVPASVAAPPSDDPTPSFFLVGPYSVSFAGMSAGGSFDPGETSHEVHNYQFDDFIIAGLVFKITAATGNLNSKFGFGLPVGDLPEVLNDERLILTYREVGTGFANYNCLSTITGFNPFNFSRPVVCPAAKTLLGSPANWQDDTARITLINQGYPFSVVPYSYCRSFGDPEPCSVSASYWLVAYGIPPGETGGGGGDGELPECPPGAFATDGLTIEWMASCYHCLAGAGGDPDITPEPSPTIDPVITPTATPFAPTAVPQGSPTPQATSTPDPSAPFDQWRYVEGVIETGTGSAFHQLTTSDPFPVNAFLIEYIVYPYPFAMTVSVIPPSTGVTGGYLETLDQDGYRYYQGINTYDIDGAILPKVGYTRDKYSLYSWLAGSEPFTIQINNCIYALCKLYYRVWFLTNSPPPGEPVPVNSPWSDTGGIGSGGAGGAGGGLSCSVPEYVDPAEDGGGVDTDLIDWDLNLREGSCMTIVPGIDEEVAGQTLQTPAVSICPTYIDLPEVVILDFPIPLVAIFLLPIGMFLVNWLRTI